MYTGRVCRSSREIGWVVREAGEIEEVRLSGSLRHRGDSLPVTGDLVSVRDGLIVELMPRRTKISRRAAGTREQEQVLAANVDLIFVVCGLDGDFNLRRIERYLVLCRESGASSCVVLSKSDLCADLEARVAQVRAAAGDVPLIACSARVDGGLASLEAMLRPGMTVALLGSSGAGKSTIINQLLGVSQQATREVRSHDSRGRHTTTLRELFLVECGAWVIDTPGLREIQLWADDSAVDEVFADVAALIASCRFSDCGHTNEPGCGVRAALADGSLDEARWRSYGKLAREVAGGMEKRELKRLHKMMRRSFKQR